MSMHETIPASSANSISTTSISKNKTKLIIAIIAGVIVICIIAVVLFLLIRSYRATSQKQTDLGAADNTVQTTADRSAQNIAVVTNDNPSCSLPVVDYKSNAFSIGVPKGWLYKVEAGTVSIMQDDSNTTAAFLYTAKLQKDLSANDFLNQFAYIFQKTIENVKGTFSMGTPEVSDDTASAEINATVDGVTVRGKMTTEKSAGFITLRSYWAPIADYDAQEPVLQEVVSCFGRTRILTDDIILSAHDDTGVLEADSTIPSTMSSFQGTYFKLNKPDNFKVTAETDSGIDLTRNDGNAGFSYAYTTGFTGTYTPKTWAQKALPQYARISGLALSEGRSIQAAIKGQSIQEFDFTGKLNGTSVKGKTTVGIYSTPYIGFGDHYTSAFWGIEIATPSVWDSVKATLQAIQDSLEVTDIGATRKNTILPANRPMESTSSSSITSGSSYSETEEKSSSDNWADAMRGYETVESPSTGDKIDVPLNSWSSYGPDGPGYYHLISGGNTLEKLNQTN